MKKTGLLVLLLGFVLMLPGCGFTEGTDAVVTVVHATPTPEPTPTPEATPTPEPTPTPAIVYEQTPSGLNVEVKSGTYTATADLNLRSDAMAEGDFIAGIPNGTVLTSTGVVENGWVRVEYDGNTGYVTGDYVVEVTEEASAEGTEETPAE